METLVKTEKLNQLFSYYQNLLTDKQQTYFKEYYYYDLSLQEISNKYNVSRNAIFDQLKTTEKNLNDFESKLKLVSLSKKRIDLIDKYLETKDSKYLNELRKMDL
ncbi:MAG: sigma factor-like helix-turn-helix DNA-binding protein [Acholeplasmataceae bacterium]